MRLLMRPSINLASLTTLLITCNAALCQPLNDWGYNPPPVRKQPEFDEPSKPREAPLNLQRRTIDRPFEWIKRTKFQSIGFARLGMSLQEFSQEAVSRSVVPRLKFAVEGMKTLTVPFACNFPNYGPVKEFDCTFARRYGQWTIDSILITWKNSTKGKAQAQDIFDFHELLIARDLGESVPTDVGCDWIKGPVAISLIGREYAPGEVSMTLAHHINHLFKPKN